VGYTPKTNPRRRSRADTNKRNLKKPTTSAKPPRSVRGQVRQRELEKRAAAMERKSRGEEINPITGSVLRKARPKKAAAKKVPAKKAAAKKPVAEKPVAEKPVAKKAAANKPKRRSNNPLLRRIRNRQRRVRGKG
jgi:hypothetical protein